ncbi:thioredoxin-like protein [Crassisporium funariophilum]|nr:thioredoxin-like protein [Crassisporium funariophilum]
MVSKSIVSLEDFKTIINRPTSRPVIINFYELWSDPCKYISPIYERLSGEPAYGGLDFYKVDVSARPDVGEACRLMVVPTIAVYKGGRYAGGVTASDAKELRALLQRHC